MKKYLNNKGITLIVLVITIIILLILAGISIASLTGNGLFERAKEAKEKSMQAQYEEELNLIISNIKIDSVYKNEDFNIEEIIKKLPEYLEAEEKKDYEWDTTQTGENPEGEYKGYSFYIDNNYQVHVEEK